MVFTDARAAHFDQCHWLSDSALAQWLVGHLQAHGKIICEVGAGTGNLAAALEQVFARVFLLEPSGAMISRMEERLSKRASSAVILQGFAEAIPLADKSVDIALSKSSLHHFANQSAGLAEMTRIAARAVAIMEVVSPDDCCLDYARQLVLRKEPSRSPATIFRESDLENLVHSVCSNHRTLHFDQYMDIGHWLDASELPGTTKQMLYDFALAQTGVIRDKMQIHMRSGRLVQLRRMALVVGAL